MSRPSRPKCSGLNGTAQANQEQMSVVREDNDSLIKRLDERRRDAQHLGGRLASLEALQQAALGQGGKRC